MKLKAAFSHYSLVAIFGVSLIIGMVPGKVSASSLPAYVPAGVSGSFDTATGMFNYNASNTARTKAAFASAGTSQANQLFVGDSLTAGWNSLNVIGQASADRDKSYPYYYRRAINTALGRPAENSTGLVRAFELSSFFGQYMDGRWSGAPNGITIQAKGHYMYVSGGSIEFNSGAAGYTPVAGTVASVTYIDGATFNISIDGGPAQTIVGRGTGQVMRYSKSGLANKTHKITISSALGSYAQVVGAEVSSGTGIVAHNVAQGGSGVTSGAQNDWSLAGIPTASMSGTFSSSAGYNSTPSTVYIMLGANDLSKSYAAIRDGIFKTAGFYRNSDIVLVAEYQPSAAFSSVDMKPLIGMLYKLAQDNNWPLWDLQYVTGGYDQLSKNGYVGDTYGHLNPAGYKMLGDRLAVIMTRLP